MATPDRNAFGRYGSVPSTRAGELDLGLRAYMSRVYGYMAFGLGLTTLAAWITSSLAVSDTPTQYALGNGTYLTNFGATLYGSPLMWVVFLAPIALVFLLSFRVHKMSVPAAQTTFWIYAALVGVSLSSIFLVYTTASIVQVFLVTGVSFGALSLYGYTTGRDLTGWGSFLFMGLIGIILASIVNIFIGSDALSFAVSVIGVLVFAGLTAYDTQKIKEMYYVGDDGVVAGRKAVMGALSLYLDFVNLFLMLLRLFGGNRE